jgi:hypothetical protein
MILVTWTHVPVEASHPKWTTSFLSGSHDHPSHKNSVELSGTDKGLENEVYESGVSYMIGWKVTQQEDGDLCAEQGKAKQTITIFFNDTVSCYSYIVLLMDEWVDTLV